MTLSNTIVVGLKEVLALGALSVALCVAVLFPLVRSLQVGPDDE